MRSAGTTLLPELLLGAGAAARISESPPVPPLSVALLVLLPLDGLGLTGATVAGGLVSSSPLSSSLGLGLLPGLELNLLLSPPPLSSPMGLGLRRLFTAAAHIQLA